MAQTGAERQASFRQYHLKGPSAWAKRLDCLISRDAYRKLTELAHQGNSTLGETIQRLIEQRKIT